MPAAVFGRTNLPLPPVWLRLASTPGEDRERLVGAAVEAGVPIDVTINPALWGASLRGAEPFLTVVGRHDYERATDDRHAGDLIQAHLLQVLSSLGRETVDLYFVRVRRAAEEYQIAGVLESLEMARQEGHIRFFGIACDGPALATLGVWQFHDAFEALLVPRSPLIDEPYRTLSPMARDRRVGLVADRLDEWAPGRPFWTVGGPWSEEAVRRARRALVARYAGSHPVIASVSSEAEVRSMVDPGLAGDEDALAPFLEAWRAEVGS